MQYNIFINGEILGRIDPATLEAIEASFDATLESVGGVKTGPMYSFRDIYLISNN